MDLVKKWSLGYLADNGLIIHDYRTGGDLFPVVMNHRPARMIFAGTDNERSAQPGCAQTGISLVVLVICADGILRMELTTSLN